MYDRDEGFFNIDGCILPLWGNFSNQTFYLVSDNSPFTWLLLPCSSHQSFQFI